MTKTITQADLVMEYFVKNPNRPIAHPEVVDWLTSEYPNRTGKTFRDPDRAIRKLSQEGKLVKLRKGVYKYDPELVTNPELEDFTAAQKEQIFKARQLPLCDMRERTTRWRRNPCGPYQAERLRWRSNYRERSNPLCNS